MSKYLELIGIRIDKEGALEDRGHMSTKRALRWETGVVYQRGTFKKWNKLGGERRGGNQYV